jgi:hypothetical protein
MIQYLWLIPVGFVIGAFGTLIGAGGGFVLMPVLLVLYPQESPEIITSISLAVVFFNAFSGSWAYARMGRIDYKSGLLFAAAAVPGAILGALNTAYIPRRLFDGVFGLILVAVSVVLLVTKGPSKSPAEHARRGQVARTLIENDGTVHAYHVDLKRGVGLSFFVGYISSLLGIGGGIVHVPVLVNLLNFPVHIATATSHFILAIIALAGTIAHIASGSFTHGIRRTICLAIGVLVGAQVGALLSSRVHGKWIIRGLAIALGFVGIRILMMAL